MWSIVPVYVKCFDENETRLYNYISISLILYNNFMVFFPVSIFLKGEQMIPILNAVGTHAAVYGNHDFGN